jgi:hypothetical protein
MSTFLQRLEVRVYRGVPLKKLWPLGEPLHYRWWYMHAQQQYI